MQKRLDDFLQTAPPAISNIRVSPLITSAKTTIYDIYLKIITTKLLILLYL